MSEGGDYDRAYPQRKKIRSSPVTKKAWFAQPILRLKTRNKFPFGGDNASTNLFVLISVGRDKVAKLPPSSGKEKKASPTGHKQFAVPLSVKTIIIYGFTQGWIVDRNIG